MTKTIFEMANNLRKSHNSIVLKTALRIIFFISYSLYADTPYVEYKFVSPGDMFQERLFEYFPKDIAHFLDNYRNCAHWSGETAYDDQRERSIAEGVNNYCIDFDQSLKNLEKKYQGNSKLIDMKTMIKEVDSGESLNYSFIWNDPQKKSKVLSKYIEAGAQETLRSVEAQMKEYDILIKKRSEKKKLETIKFQLGIQSGYLQQVLREIDRLHPITRKRIKELEMNQIFWERAGKSK